MGRIVFTADDAVKRMQAEGRKKEEARVGVVLVRAETTPDDIHGMEVAKGILTSRGGMTSHAAVVARGMGTPCVAGAGRACTWIRKRSASKRGKTTLKEGDWISLDGSTGDVFAGQSSND